MLWVGKLMDRKRARRLLADQTARAAEVWTVRRHSGRGSGPSREASWVERFKGPEDKARAKYAKISAAMRQGGVRLLRPDGTIDSERHEPRVRTRW